MDMKLLIKYIYIFFTVFSLLATTVTNTSFIDVIPGIFLMWTTYMFFIFGYGKEKKGDSDTKIKSSFSKFVDFIISKRFLVVILAISFSIIIAKYYTGNSPANVFKSIINGNSLYYQYQAYYKTTDISFFSISKIPFILMNAGLNLLFIASVISIIIKKEKIVFKDVLYLSIITFSFIYFGLARGTNFEMFEMGCAYLYAIVMRFKLLNVKKINKKSYLFLLIIGIVGVSIFLNTFAIRGSTGEFVTKEIHYESSKLIPSLFPSFAISISKLTSYFGFGFFYSSAYFTRLLPNDPNALLYSFIPFGYKIFENTNIVDKMELFINTGVNWKADVVWLIGTFGIVGAMLIFVLLGKLSRNLHYKALVYDDYIYHIANYYLFLQMFSFPIGNFIRVSSANTLMVLFISFLLILNLFKRNRIY